MALPISMSAAHESLASCRGDAVDRIDTYPQKPEATNR